MSGRKALNELVSMIHKEKRIPSDWNDRIVKLKEIVMENLKEDKSYEYCSKCGREIKSDYVYCPYCGEENL